MHPTHAIPPAEPDETEELPLAEDPELLGKELLGKELLGKEPLEWELLAEGELEELGLLLQA